MSENPTLEQENLDVWHGTSLIPSHLAHTIARFLLPHKFRPLVQGVPSSRGLGWVDLDFE